MPEAAVEAAVVVTKRLFDAGGLVPGLDGGVAAADVFMPPPGVRARPIAFCCLAGGGMSRAYWDLRVPGDDTYSFARWSAARGFPVITVDHLGVGESVLPADAAAPLLRDVIAANDAVLRVLCDELRRFGIGGRPIPDLRTVGVGHSMGAVLTVRQQSVYSSHEALSLFGFSTAGLPDQLSQISPELLSRADRPIDDQRVAKLARLMFGSPYAVLNTVTASDADSPIKRALQAAATVTLTAGGLLSMLPGNVARELSRLTVPVLILNGDRDPLVTGRPEDAAHCPAGSASRVVAGSGHNHNAAELRHEFWIQLVDWARSVLQGASPRHAWPNS